VAALPYDVLSTAEAREISKGNPLSFLHVDKPEMALPDDTPQYAPATYQQAKVAFEKLLASGAMMQDSAPCFYIYRQMAGSRTQTGLCACVDVAAYDAGDIKKHELTRTAKEKDRVDHVDILNAHTGPIFLAYRAASEPRAIIDEWTKNHPPVYDFKTEDGVGQAMWVVNETGVIEQLVKAFSPIDSLYIADGHHRAAAASRVAAARANKDASAECNRFLAMIFPHDELEILDYNRIVKDLNGKDVAGFLEAVGEKFTVEPRDIAVKPKDAMCYGAYVAGKWYLLKYKEQAPADVVERLAVSVLQKQLLEPVLGIQDPQTDRRIDFVGGARGTAELERRVDSGEMAVAFTVCATKLTDLMDVSDAERIMPPKSTWFEPKLRSGLLIHRFG
jgi:uncharacterized protein (DUF1015 family)